MNKLSLVGIQLPERYKENSTLIERRPFVWSYSEDEGPSLETSKFSLYFSGSFIPTNESLFMWPLFTTNIPTPNTYV
jgi:hypothetical protein